ncbi:MAG TPA: sugar phosphate isomerase/epimerase family protein [Sphingobium sp.]|uniref:sugar phosphate isomerase/epimerase family protein n=1 Tax=Sphingobium sp. TaxID=1912891 RepID=UPI002ED5480C
MQESTVAFIDHCRRAGIAHMTLATPLITRSPGGADEARQAMASGGPHTTVLNHPFATFPDLENDEGEASAELIGAMDLAASLGCSSIYLQTGGRGTLTWEQAAERFAQLLGPARQRAGDEGIALMIENASPFNIDMHIAHTLADTIELAEYADIGICIDLQPCWGEARLPKLFRRALPRTGLVQVSDYVLGDRVAPCRAVPGDGAVPLKRLIAELAEAGYDGLFDIELVGPRITQEGPAAASLRAAHWLSNTLIGLGL